MHRYSAQYIPEAPITHHWFDSTHIIYGAVTAGLAGKSWQIDASAFRGREPDENRWGIEAPRFVSWSVRAAIAPSPQWLMQASFGKLKEPETAHPGEDERRFVTSAHFRPFGHGRFCRFARPGARWRRQPRHLRLRPRRQRFRPMYQRLRPRHQRLRPRHQRLRRLRSERIAVRV